MPPSTIPADAHVYRPFHRQAAFFFWFGWVYMLVFPAFIAWIVLHPHYHAHPSPASRAADLWSAATVIAVSIFAGAAFTFRGAKFSVILSPDTLKMTNLFDSKTLHLTQIVGRRIVPSRNGGRLAFVYLDKNNHRRKFVTRGEIVYDDYFNNWLATIPDLDAIEKEKRRAAGKLHIWEV